MLKTQGWNEDKSKLRHHSDFQFQEKHFCNLNIKFGVNFLKRDSNK